MTSARRLLPTLLPLLLCLIAFATPASASPQEGEAAPEQGWFAELEQTLDSQLGDVNGAMAGFIFYDLASLISDPTAEGHIKIPLAVLMLVLAAIFFTLRMGLPQLKAFGHAIAVVRGKYDDPNAKGEVSSFQALTAALSATVGLGNIGGVAIAVATGGPGATFWMICAGFLGMASKLTECSLGQMYRETRPNGQVMGGAMYYLSNGLKEMKLGGLGKVLAILFCIFCIGASFGGGNTFQVSQSMGVVKTVVPYLEGREWIYGAVLSILVAVVILGGIKRIASTAEKIVPFMCSIFVLSCLAVLAMNIGEIPGAVGKIISGAFNAEALGGGFLGVLMIGFQRAAFSNEAGIGSAAIAHAAAKVPHPSREGIVALLEPFIDTIVVCTMTALVIVITGAYNDPDPALVAMRAADDGAALTNAAMTSALGDWFKYVLSVAVFLFAYSTMISWSYYGERCWAYMFGDKTSIIYKIIFVCFVFIGSIVSAKNVLDFGDLLIFGMAFPNIVGVVLLSGKVKAKLDDYLTRLKAGEYQTYN